MIDGISLAVKKITLKGTIDKSELPQNCEFGKNTILSEDLDAEREMLRDAAIDLTLSSLNEIEDNMV
jgi:hypothetical protein